MLADQGNHDLRFSPGRLQHHDTVFSLKGAGWGKSDVNIGDTAAMRIAVAATSHPTNFNTTAGRPGGVRLQPGGERVELKGKQHGPSGHPWRRQADFR